MRRRQHRPKPLIPDWFPSSHPLNLPQSVRRAIARDFNPDAVFLNIPYSRRYTNLEVAMISTLTAYGLVPQMAKTRVGLEVRLHKIAALMLGCGYGVTDLTYVRRMNMPLELGVLLAWGKHTFVASERPYGTIKTISDLNFGDVHYHRQRVGELVRQLSRWIEQHCSRKRFSVSILMSRYRRLQRIRRSLGPDFEKLTPSEISKLLGIVEEEFSMKLVPSV